MLFERGFRAPSSADDTWSQAICSKVERCSSGVSAALERILKTGCLGCGEVVVEVATAKEEPER
jgi:hypothetical protein